MLELIVLGLATFRLTHLVGVDTIFRPFRKLFINETEEGISPKYQKGVGRFLGELLSCYWCISMWMAFGLLTLHYFLPVFSFWFSYALALSAIASLLEAFTFKKLW